MISMLSGENEDQSSESIHAMEFETPSRYLSSEFCDVSDPEEWTTLRYREDLPVPGREQT